MRHRIADLAAARPADVDLRSAARLRRPCSVFSNTSVAFGRQLVAEEVAGVEREQHVERSWSRSPRRLHMPRRSRAAPIASRWSRDRAGRPSLLDRVRPSPHRPSARRALPLPIASLAGASPRGVHARAVPVARCRCRRSAAPSVVPVAWPQCVQPSSARARSNDSHREVTLSGRSISRLELAVLPIVPHQLTARNHGCPGWHGGCSRGRPSTTSRRRPRHEAQPTHCDSRTLPR